MQYLSWQLHSLQVVWVFHVTFSVYTLLCIGLRTKLTSYDGCRTLTRDFNVLAALDIWSVLFICDVFSLHKAISVNTLFLTPLIILSLIRVSVNSPKSWILLSFFNSMTYYPMVSSGFYRHVKTCPCHRSKL